MSENFPSDLPHMDETQIRPWAEGFLHSLLELWLHASDDPSGLFYPYLDREWNRMPGEGRTLVSQCRLIYNFSQGMLTSGDARFAKAVVHGLSALQTCFRRDDGGWRWAVHADGSEADEHLDAYGHAFVILCLATASHALAKSSWADLARETWQYVERNCFDSAGGIIWHSGPEYDPSEQGRSQNPMMHLFEALMALDRVDTTGEARAGATRLLSFVERLTNFSQGRLVESYAPDWTPLSAEQGGYVDLGHAFEWAFLMSEWHRLTGSEDVLAVGTRFLQTGLSFGIGEQGAVLATCDLQGNIISAKLKLWPQCEGIRALNRYALQHGHTEALAVRDRCLAFYQYAYVDHALGGVFAGPVGRGELRKGFWIDGQAEASDRPETDYEGEAIKGDAWKLDYHSVGMLLELLR